MSADFACPLVPVSWGELLDKITILEIKRARILKPEARANICAELRLLRRVAGPVLGRQALAPLMERLRTINAALWDIEDAIRKQEAVQDFGPRFVELARAVYVTNDDRAAVKREMNAVLGSELVEEKSYADFGRRAPAPAYASAGH